MMTLKALPLKTMDSAALTLAILEATGNDPLVFNAIRDATFLHRNQTRANRGQLERTSYIEHPLRGALRLIRWGVTDRDLIIAAILHDTVEDCAADILIHFLSIDPSEISEAEARAYAADWIRITYGIGAATLVMAVTNEFPVPGATRAERAAAYVEHARAGICSDVRVFLVKFTDYMDNAAGLYHNDVPGNRGMVVRLAGKYLPMADVFEDAREPEALLRYVNREGLAEITLKIRTSRKRLEKLAA